MILRGGTPSLCKLVCDGFAFAAARRTAYCAGGWVHGSRVPARGR
jgi:hypothetical protein